MRSTPLGLLLLVAACDGASHHPRTTTAERPTLEPERPTATAVPTDAEVARDAPLTGPGPGKRALAVPGFSDAVVVVPPGRGPFGVLVAAHGNFDRPEWECATWSTLVRGRAFVLCPRGRLRDDIIPDWERYTYPSQAAMNREFDAALRALRETFGDRVARRPIAYVGFSLGAIYAVGYFRATAEPIGAAMLVEGGHSFWSSGAIRDFSRNGGRAVLFGCGQRSCVRDAQDPMRRLRDAGLDVDLASVPGAGHGYTGPIAERMAPAFERMILPVLQPGG